ncbi:hypothetical protein [Arsenicibacter rosenii]|uniref:Glycosyltransferase WbuB n=1 Tax=Arsenicibacter rosenii TaxID=1750698 RepID=A0A1S2VGR5_9BACT|nr:hypothetical protein [Arsenicibacter rosenii]OIN57923.1 hypothetical protein BLX24_17685 [Arsenicibacter rosenii]
MKPTLTIVNRHYPPNPGITGETAWDLAKYLIEQHDIAVQIVHIDRTYDGGGAIRQPVGDTFAVQPIYKGNNGLLKLITGLIDGWLLIRKAIKVRRGPLLIMTSPPLLPFWASRLLTRRRIPYWLWSMDLFPEGFAAEGKISDRNPVYRWVMRQTYRHAPQLLVALGPGQAEHLRHQYQQPDLNTIILPCGVLMHQDRDMTPPAWRQNDGKLYIGYAGNVAQPHSADFLKSIMQHIDPERQHLVLALYGRKAPELLQLASGRAGITLLPNIPRNQLHFLDLQLVTLLPQWTHIAVPSKAVSGVCSGSPVLFCGRADSDSYRLLKEAAFFIEDTSGLDQRVAQFLHDLRPQQLVARKNNASQVADSLQAMVKTAYDAIAREVRVFKS